MPPYQMPRNEPPPKPKMPIRSYWQEVSWKRADPEELKKFDPATKQCIMNCDQHEHDPRSAAEILFMCERCLISKI